MVTDGPLISHIKILAKQVPEEVYVPNIPAMSISFLLHGYRPNHELIQCLSNWPEWVDLSWCD